MPQRPIKRKKQKVLWAIDPFMKEGELQSAALRCAHALFGGAVEWIEPVHVFNVSPLRVPAPFSAELLIRTEAAAAGRARALVPRALAGQALPLKLLPGSFAGLQEEAGALLQYARERQADLIAVSTHGRRGLGRWVMGSFAETLMLYSRIPLLIVSPRWKARSDLRKVLFPTDFGSESRRAFDRLVASLAASSGKRAAPARVTLFHHVPPFIAPDLSGLADSMAAYRGVLRRLVEDRSREGAGWAADAARKGVRVSVRIDSRTPGSSADAILKESGRGAGLIAMAAIGGRLSIALLGSTTRRVLRGSDVPVWVIRERGDAQDRRSPYDFTGDDAGRDLYDPGTSMPVAASPR